MATGGSIMIGYERGILKRLRVRKKKGRSTSNQLVTHMIVQKLLLTTDTFCVLFKFYAASQLFRDNFLSKVEGDVASQQLLSQFGDSEILIIDSMHCYSCPSSNLYGLGFTSITSYRN